MTHTPLVDESQESVDVESDIEEVELLFQEIDSDSESNQSATPDVSFKSLQQIKELVEKLEEKQSKVNEELTRKSIERTIRKERDECDRSEESRVDIIQKFVEENKNRYQLRNEQHEIRLKKLREEQIAIQDRIFGRIE